MQWFLKPNAKCVNKSVPSFMLLLQSSSGLNLNQTLFANWKPIIKNFPDIALFQVLQVSQISRKTQNCPLKTSLRSMKLALDRLTLKNFKNITALGRHPLTLRTWRTHATIQQLPFMSQYTFMWNHYLDYWTLAAVLNSRLNLARTEWSRVRMRSNHHLLSPQIPITEGAIFLHSISEINSKTTQRNISKWSRHTKCKLGHYDWWTSHSKDAPFIATNT